MKNLWLLGALMGLVVLVGAGCATADVDVSGDLSDNMGEELMEGENDDMEDGEDEDEMMLADGEYTLDAEASTVQWFAAKVTGEHNGFVAVSSGDMMVEDGMLASGMVAMDMTTITNEDVEGDMNAQLVTHLMSDDFFSVEGNPTATFEITSVESQGEGMYRVVGDMTIKGITVEESFIAVVEEEDGMVSVEGAMTIDRTDYDIKFRSGSFFENLGDIAIDDEFTLDLDLVFAS